MPRFIQPRLLAVIGIVTAVVLMLAGRAAAQPTCSQSSGVVTCAYEFTGGEQLFQAPAGSTVLTIDAVGASGGGDLVSGGLGATASATVAVGSGEQLFVEVGGAGGFPAGVFNGAGFNGGGVATDGAGGGGASDVQKCSRDSAGCSRLDEGVVAGGGGGSGTGGAGGNAGSPGGAGTAPPGQGTGGGGGGAGTLSSGGAGGAAGVESPGNGNAVGLQGGDGGPGQGGTGADQHGFETFGGGGGGGGYFGGGGGGSGFTDLGFGRSSFGGGGGGGSSFPADATIGTASSGQAASVAIAYVGQLPSPPVASITSPASGSTFVFGQQVSTSFSCSPGANGPGVFSCVDGAGSSSGSGTLDTGALGSNKTYTVTAVNGDGQSAANTLSYSVTKADTTPTVANSSPSPSVVGQAVTVNIAVSPEAPGAGTPTGSVVVSDATGASCTATLSAAAGSCTIVPTEAGTDALSLHYGGDADFNSSDGAASLVVDKADTSTSVTSSESPSVFGQSVKFTATVSPVTPGAGSPTGTVTFFDGDQSIGTGTLDGSGQATLTTSALGVGDHTITARYGADGDFNESTGSLTGDSQVVDKAHTSTAVTSSQNPSVVGQSVKLTATVSPVAPGAGSPTGTVTFLDGGTEIGTGTLGGSGHATLTTSALGVGDHSIIASYGGDGNFNGSSRSLAGNPQVVTKADTSTGVTSSHNASVFGQSVKFTATVSPVAPGAGTPTGTVTFRDGGTEIGTGTLDGSGQATLTSSTLAVGNHTITASYDGDGSFNGSNGSLTGNPQAVDKADTSTGVTSSENPSAFGQSVKLTATIDAVAPGAGTPTGTVRFLDGGIEIGTGTVDGGRQATLTTSALGVGDHTITANYGGDGSFDGSTGSLAGNPQLVAGPPSAHITSPADDQTYSLGQRVVTSFSCKEAPGGPGIRSCVDSGGASDASGELDTSAIGRHTYTVTATSRNGQTAAATLHYTVAGAPSVTISTPVDGAHYAFDQQVLAGYRCADGADGPGISVCTASVTVGARIPTSSAGAQQFTVTAISTDGQRTTRTVTYAVLPDRAFLISHLRTTANGTVRLRATVPGKGRIDVLETVWLNNPAHATAPAHRIASARAHKTTTHPGTLRLRSTPNRHARRHIAHHTHAITLRLRITYTPTGGTPFNISLNGLHLRCRAPITIHAAPGEQTHIKSPARCRT